MILELCGEDTFLLFSRLNNRSSQFAFKKFGRLSQLLLSDNPRAILAAGPSKVITVGPAMQLDHSLNKKQADSTISSGFPIRRKGVISTIMAAKSAGRTWTSSLSNNSTTLPLPRIFCRPNASAYPTAIVLLPVGKSYIGSCYGR